ncbi:hypothetical protein [Helicobacter sp. T3_23-1059]
MITIDYHALDSAKTQNLIARNDDKDSPSLAEWARGWVSCRA